MEKNRIKPIAIAKFSEEKYLNEIIKNEELFFNIIEYFSKKENQNYRFDQYEGYDRIYQPNYITDFKFDGISFKLAKNESPIKIRLSTTEYFSHICCFTYFTNKIIMRRQERKVFDPRLFSFGKHFILGLEIRRFLENIGSACANDSNITRWKIGPVEYVDVKTHNGVWDVFHKPLKYKYQNELRIAIQVNTDQPYRLKVPGLSSLIIGITEKDKCINEVINEKAIIS